ncbi:DUF1643 domain-containing protein [Peribacillus sp. NPDC096379]|uniref:DUF1643 domain-containing protein n=1 Tax=Peribacillus sp. NPDC096379 TaxID=3364393 RepID=UPI003830E4E6
MKEKVLRSTHKIETEAIFSECGNYRYSLSRSVAGKDGKMTFIMFNPNVRDDIQLGATANYCFNYAIENKYGKVEIVNLFALRTKSIRALKEKVKNNGIDPVGPLNNYYIQKSIQNSDKIVLAWGSNGGFNRRDREVLKLLNDSTLFCFSKSRKGKPGYPKRSMDIDITLFD